MTLLAVTPERRCYGVARPGFAIKGVAYTYDWRLPVGDAGNTRRVEASFAVVDLGEALTVRWPTDAHFVCYLVRQNGAPMLRQPRIRKVAGTLPWLREQGFEITADVFAADVDNPGHGPWTPELRAAFDRLLATAPALATAVVYLTKHGFRIVQPLTHALPVELYERALRAWLLMLEAQGVAVDWRCSDWTRHYRLPRVKRDGQPQDFEILNLEKMRPIAPPDVTESVGPETKGRARRPHGVTPTETLPALWIERAESIAAPMRDGFTGQRHDVALALAGALLGRKVPPEYVAAIVEHVTTAAGWDGSHHGKGAADTVDKWCAGERVSGVGKLGEIAPTVLEAVERLFWTSPSAEPAAAPQETIDEATARMTEAIRNAPQAVSLIQAGCGLGKTRAARKVALERAADGKKTAIVVPTTRLAKAQVEYLRAEGAGVVRFFGVLSVLRDDGTPECRYEKAARKLAAGGQSIPRELCVGRVAPCEYASGFLPGTPWNEVDLFGSGCKAFNGREGPDDARIAIGPHSLLHTLVNWAGTTGLLVIDEAPQLLVSERFDAKQLDAAALMLVHFEPRYAAAMAVVLRAATVWLKSSTDLDVSGSLERAFACGVDPVLLERAFLMTGARDAASAARAAFDEKHQGTAPPVKPNEMVKARKLPDYAGRIGEASRVLGALWNCLNVPDAVVRIEARTKREFVCTWPDAEVRVALAHEAPNAERDVAIRGPTVLLDAAADLQAPVVAKLAGYAPPLHTFAAVDGAPVERVLGATHKAKRTAWLPHGRLEVAGGVVIAVRAARQWARDERVGVITFQPLAFALRAARGEDVGAAWAATGRPAAELEAARAVLAPLVAGWHVEIGHYGGMRGLDAWSDLDALVTLGDPWPHIGDVQFETDYLGLEDWEPRAEAKARAELEQAHGRLRVVHRTRPARMLHVGALVPAGWPSWTVWRPSEGRPENVDATPPDVRELVQALGGVTAAAKRLGIARKTLGRYLAGQRGMPPDVERALRDAS